MTTPLNLLRSVFQISYNRLKRKSSLEKEIYGVGGSIIKIRKKPQMFNFKNFKTQIKTILGLIILIILYNEYIIYVISSIDWPPFMQCGSRNKYCLKVLFVADPQLIGEVYGEPRISGIARWDSDRYVEKNYRLAVDKFKPDVVVFLGDLMDEGSIAGDQEFSRYFHRFQMIFPPNYKLQYIWIPGDNDIGGEEFRVSVNKMQRFESHFKQDKVVSINGIDFIKVNRIVHEIPKSSLGEKLNNGTNVVLSHIPILYVPGTFSKEIISTLNPALIFSAHEHKSVSIRMNRYAPAQKTITQLTNKERKVKRYRIGGDMIHEFIVPTCSYRMGVEDSGFGAAVINGYGSYLDYAVLWFPSRLRVLRNYVYLTCIILVYIVICISCYCYGNLRRLRMRRIKTYY